MLSYRELAGDLTSKVNIALERRAELLRGYDDIKSKLRITKAENEHLLDMIAEAYPDIVDLSSSDASSHDESEITGGATASPMPTPAKANPVASKRRPSARHNDGRGENGADDMPLGRRFRKREQYTGSALDISSRATKRRRRQGKRDDRNDPKPIEPLERDSSGSIKFPIVVGRGQDEVKILSLGRVVWELDTYHSSRYIWPVGFKSTRVYPSMRDGRTKCVYTSEILEGNGSPVFQVIADDMPDDPYRANSSSGVWKQILDILMANGVGVKTHASGPQMYGLSNLGVTKAIQELDNADKCAKYIMQKWIEPTLSPRDRPASSNPSSAGDGAGFARDESDDDDEGAPVDTVVVSGTVDDDDEGLLRQDSPSPGASVPSEHTARS